MTDRDTPLLKFRKLMAINVGLTALLAVGLYWIAAQLGGNDGVVAMWASLLVCLASHSAGHLPICFIKPDGSAALALQLGLLIRGATVVILGAVVLLMKQVALVPFLIWIAVNYHLYLLTEVIIVTRWFSKERKST